MADYKFLQHIDGAWRQLKRWVMYKYSGTPSDAQEGSFWYDTVTKTPKYHNGTTAKDIGKYVVAGIGTTVSASGNDLAVNVTYGTIANTSCVGNDSRLSNARTPISHAVSATTYGVGTSSNYGHVKLYTSIGNNTDGSPTNSAVSGALALKANVSQLTDGSVTKVGTANVGSVTVPVYVNAGTLTACSGTLGVSITGNSATATTATKVGSATVGSASQPIYLNAGVATVCNGSVGSATQPTYVNAGVNTACSDTLAVSITGNAATATTATRLATTRTITLTGDAAGSGSFDGSVNVSVAVTSAHLEANTGTYAPWQTKGSKNNYTGISFPGVLRATVMSHTTEQSAGMYCDTDGKWIVLRHPDGTLKTGYTPDTTSNSNEIATTAFVNSRINAQPQEYTYSIGNGTNSMVYTTNVFTISCNLVANQYHQAEAILSFSVVGDTTAANNYAGRVYMACKAQGTDPTYKVEILEGTSNIDNLLKWRSDRGASTIYCTIMFAIPAWASLNIKLDSLNGGGTWTSAFDSTLASSWTSNGTMLTYSVPTASKLGSSTVGSTNRPIYLNAGVPSSLSDTVGNHRRPVFLDAGALTAISDTVGSSDIPVYSNSGTLTACTQYFKANTGWHGSVETVGSKGNYTGISLPGVLRATVMSSMTLQQAGMYCESDSRWMMRREPNGTLTTEYTPATTSNSNEIATTAFVNSKLNQYEFGNADKIDGKHVVVTSISSRGADANTLYFCY